ncbi:MAG: HNH endonuclease [Acidobacteriota bacterium]|nr:HNH endonuclease [Blastocatellia bacterium]MDW8241334.1 HNH endonuclease [Acidobacteriota bacterium]
MLSDEVRDAVRYLYQFRCGYCGVREEDVGAELTIDHHRPTSQGGSDQLDNLVYCCSKCNAHKGSYWHETHAPQIRLLHPRQDDLTLHLHEGADGYLTGSTPEGQFLIERLRLNRPALVTYRLNQQELKQRQDELRVAREREQALRQRIEELDALLQAVTAQIQSETEGG